MTALRLHLDHLKIILRLLEDTLKSDGSLLDDLIQNDADWQIWTSFNRIDRQTNIVRPGVPIGAENDDFKELNGLVP